jgi:hypothetical protein
MSYDYLWDSDTLKAFRFGSGWRCDVVLSSQSHLHRLLIVRSCEGRAASGGARHVHVTNAAPTYQNIVRKFGV